MANARVLQLVCVAAMVAACGYLATRLSTPQPDDGTLLWVSARPLGRLGNQLFIAASASGIAKRRGATVCLRFDEWAEKAIFEAVVWPVRRCPDSWPQFEHTGEDGKYGKYLPEVVSAHPNRSIMLDGNLQSYRYWSGEALPFRLRASRWARAWIQQRGIRVGIHVRRGDYLTSEAHTGKMPPLSYYAKALARVANATVLLVCSDDPDWVEQQPVFRGAHVARGFSPGRDMALLSECDDLILSTGTFGWWAGYFKRTPGSVYYHFKPDSHAARGWFVYGDHFPAGWIAVD